MNFITLSRIIADFSRKIFADHRSKNHRNFVKKLALNFLSKNFDFKSGEKFWKTLTFQDTKCHKKQQKNRVRVRIMFWTRVEASTSIFINIRPHDCEYLRICKKMFGDARRFSTICECSRIFKNIYEDLRIFT